MTDDDTPSAPEGDSGTCAACGTETRRPPGETPTGRKFRIPKYCETCRKTTPQTPKRRAGPRNAVDIKAGMTEFYTSMGLLVATKDLEAGTLIVGKRRLEAIVESAADRDYSVAEEVGKAWADVAACHPAVADALEKFLRTGVWGELANAHAPLVALVLQRKPRAFVRVRQWFSRRFRRSGEK